jgi:hypothetical protein
LASAEISLGKIDGFGAAESLMMKTESDPVAASNSSVALPLLLRVHEGAATARVITTAKTTGMPTKIRRISDAVTLPSLMSPELMRPAA